MPEQLSNTLLVTGIALFGMVSWALSIAIVYLDVTRRKLAGSEQLGWIALVLFVPLIGFFIYLFARLMTFLASRKEAPDAGQGKPGTLLRPVSNDEGRRSTVLAADLVKDPGVYYDPPRTQRFNRKQGQTGWSLLVIEGPYAGSQFTLVDLPAEIGRGSQVLLRLDNDRGISRRHAELYIKNGSLRIRDLNSMHGTFVNGRRVQDQNLLQGDKISVGVSELIVDLQ